MNTPMVVLSKTFILDSSHYLPDHPGKCKNLHGHTWEVEVSLSGPVDPRTGMLMDFHLLSEIFEAEVLNLLDHNYLNNQVTNPTCENIAIWIFERLTLGLNATSTEAQVAKIKVKEGKGGSVSYYGTI